MGLTAARRLAFTSLFSSSSAVCVAALPILDACGCCEGCWPQAPAALPSPVPKSPSHLLTGFQREVDACEERGGKAAFLRR